MDGFPNETTFRYFRHSRTRRPAFTRQLMLAVTAAMLAIGSPFASGGQVPPSTMETGHIIVAGKQRLYRIRHLPVNAFPDIPEAIENALTDHGCIIPQTYGAHGPENVIHGSFEHPGSTDWAVLCSSGGKASLLVFLTSGTPSSPAVLNVFEETSRLQQDDATGDLGFDWGIDSATPKQVHEGTAGSRAGSAALDHDCIADSVIDRAPAYRCLQAGKWITLDSQ